MRSSIGRREGSELPRSALRIAVVTVLLYGAGLGLQWLTSAAPPLPARAASFVIDLDTVPDLDTKKKNVHLKEVIFDTFNGSYVPLSKATKKTIRRLRDAIRPIYRPRYGKVGDLAWLREDDLVLGYAVGGEAYAYPIKVLNFREIVNDTIGGEPVLISYCPLCGSAVVFSRRLAGKTLLFGNTSALYESDMVMYDHQTGSYWFQVMGRAIVGAMTGSQLIPLPSATLTWGEWKRLHPQTRLLTGDARGGFGSSYVRDPFASYPARLNVGRFAFPVSREKLDHRLPAGEVVLTVEIEEGIKAYPIRLIGDRAVNDTLAGRRIVLFSRGTMGAVFLAEISGEKLTFAFVKGNFTDRETGSVWNLVGAATAGPMKGKSLKALPGRRAFWFSLAGGVPGVKLHKP